MKAISTTGRHWKWGALALLVLALTLTWGHSRSEVAWAGVPAPDFNVVVAGTPLACDTLPNLKQCIVPPNAKFTVEVYLDSLGGVPSYDGMEIGLHYSPSLVRQGDYRMFWPDCAFQGSAGHGAPGDNQSYTVLCLGFGPSSYLGKMIEVDFVCSGVESSESITIVHGQDPGGGASAGDSYLLSGPTVYREVPGVAETLVINCTDHYPWLPWDVNGDHAVSGLDFFEVLSHFGATKP